LGDRDEAAQARRISDADAAALARSGDWVEYGTGLGQPDVFDTAPARRVDEVEDVKIRACLTLRPRAVRDADPGRDHFHWLTGTTLAMTARRRHQSRELHPLQPG
jgi:hypothetical protein